MRQHVERCRVEQQVERRAFERRARRAGARVGDLNERVALPLRLGLEPERADEIVAGGLNAIVGELALGSPCFAARRLVGLEQLELAGVARVPQGRAAPGAAAADHGLAVHRAEARVVELPCGCVQAAGGAPDPEHPPGPGAARAFDSSRRLQLRVVRGAGQLEPRADHAGPAVRVRQLRRDHVHDPAHRVRSVQHAGGSADQLHPLGQPSVDRRPVLVTPRVIFQTVPVGEHQHPGAREAPDHRLADLGAGGERVHAGEPGERMRQRHALVTTQPVFRQCRC